MIVTIRLVVCLNDEIDISEYLVSFSSDPTPDPGPGPGPRPPVPPSISLPKLPASLAVIKPVFRQVASESVSVEELLTKTSNGVQNAIGVDRFVKEFIPWRNKFTEVVDAAKITTLEEMKSIWLSVE